MLKEMRKMTGDGSVVVLPTSISGLFHQSLTKQLDGLVAFSTFKDLAQDLLPTKRLHPSAQAF